MQVAMMLLPQPWRSKLGNEVGNDLFKNGPSDWAPKRKCHRPNGSGFGSCFQMSGDVDGKPQVIFCSLSKPDGPSILRSLCGRPIDDGV